MRVCQVSPDQVKKFNSNRPFLTIIETAWPFCEVKLDDDDDDDELRCLYKLIATCLISSRGSPRMAN